MSSEVSHAAADPREIEKFDVLAHEFWDPRGAFHTLHALNPVRLAYISARAMLVGRRVLDVGCGGGLLCEAMTRTGAVVTGIDMAPAMIEVARLHAQESALGIHYELSSAEQYVQMHAGEPPFDVIVCMELIEHVPEPARLFDALARLLRPGGELFISTVNRNLRSFLLAIVGAEYLLRLLPRGTHEYARLLKPSELDAMARARGFVLRDLCGVQYNPVLRTARLHHDVSINYLAHFHHGDALA
ncbi:MAG TPA: bifunctional 2-polyprenyl-6-hydroxyphenol methylase/3-demethylubiquinol 3-O-methyltransferase UbiG [Steroidobacteraceae bacterium]|nr:bifunctional 2-polyprenyl-6-hydroxyphenol methylase/3-demethylubiquinol 3-O-methyltransferase UbiG [Steroidobacteraceae bacterium]